MLKKQLYIISLAAICLMLGQAAAISENFTFIENESITLENDELITSEINELMADETFLVEPVENKGIEPVENKGIEPVENKGIESVENNESASYENNESIPSENGFSELFSLAPLNPEFEEYLDNKELTEDRILLTSGEAFEGETKNLATGLFPAPVDLSRLKTVENLEGLNNCPASYDLRALGRVSPVRDQMDAGSCWAFGAYASLESYILGTEGKNMDFSENNIKNLLSEEYPGGFDRTFDGGGNALMTTAYFTRWSGPVSETDDPYDSHSGLSPADLPSLKRIQEVLFIPARNGPEDNDLIKWALMNYGVVDSVIHMSGTYDAVNCTYYYGGSKSGDHMIGIVGWDDSFDRNKFTPAAPGDGAFIVKNSWGTGWGDEGFFYVSYYDTVFGSENIVHKAEDLSSYSHVYQYDPLGWVESIGCHGSDTAWAANVFTAEKAETLEAVSFYTADSSTRYEIYIYTDPVSGPINPAGSKTCTNGTIPFAGYHTVPLESGVPLNPGQNFSVVVKFTSPGYSFPVAAEFPLTGYSSKARANTGESFFSPDGERWVDTALVSENMSVCIKAFTNRSEAAKAAFTANVTSGTAPLTVGFIDASTLSPTAWHWDFGDGNTSTERFPVHNYMAAGKYNVTLCVENGYGNSTIKKTEWVSASNASLLHVDDDGPADFTSIQAAVDAASPNATIIVCNGTYTENVDVDRAVTILSESGPEYAKVRAANPKDSVFHVTADGVNISGFSISGGSELAFSTSCPTAGIWLYDVRDCNISGNVLSDNYCGILVFSLGNCTLNGNRAESNDIGIYMSSPERNILRNNRMENNSYNFAIPRASLEQDIDKSNTVNGKPIYYLVNKSNLALDSGSNAGTVYCINCQNMTVRDLNLTGNYYGLYCYNTVGSHFENISSSKNGYGFYISGSSGLNLTDNNASSNSCGLYIKDSKWESLSGNRMEGNACNFDVKGDSAPQSVPSVESSNLLNGKPLYIVSGVSDYVLGAGSDAGSVYLLNCQNITVRDMAFQNESYGVYLYGTERSALKNNTFSGNYCGAYLEDSGNNTVQENEFSGNSLGICLEASSGNSLANNNMTGNSEYGIYLSEARNNTIRSNNASGGYIGIHAVYSENNTFVENAALSNALGLYLLDSDYNNLTANTANSNSQSGFDLTISQYNTLSGNNASGNARGITLQGWTGEVFTSDNILSCNTVSNNSEFGIWLTAAMNNTFYGNSFNNTKNVEDRGHNIWNTTAGNYWSDYKGSDVDCNGIGDTPYVISSLAGSKDYLPICREPGTPRTITVGCDAGDFSSIKAAVNAARDGDTVLVRPGTYTENVQVNKSISIISSSGNPEDTIVHAADSEENVFNVAADSVNISGFTISGASEDDAAGVYMEGVSGCSLSRNILSDSYLGVWFNGAENCTLSENSVTGGRFGIYFLDSYNNSAGNNSINMVSTCGLWFSRSGANVLRNNSIKNSTFSFMDYYAGYENILPNDIDTSNLVNGKPIYYLVGKSDLVLDSTSNASTVYLINCENITVRDLVLEKNGCGVFAFKSSNSTLYNLTLSDNMHGTFVMESSNFTLNNLAISDNIYGIMGIIADSNCSNNTLENNNYFGIYLYAGKNNTLDNNSISESDFGLMLVSDSSVLRNNILSDNEYNFGILGISGNGENYIDTSNLVDGKPIYYLSGESDRVIDVSSNAGTVYLVGCENITVRDQVLEHNMYGLFLYNTTNSSLENNNVSLNNLGIYLYDSDINILRDNNLSDNNGGLELYSSENNSIYNNLFRNLDNVILVGTNTGNTWNVSRTEGPNILGDPYIGGNCWANPEGTGFSETTPDANEDGFCDMSYKIPYSENEFDNLPLHISPKAGDDEKEDEEEESGSSRSGGSRSALFGGVSGVSSTNVVTASVSRQQVVAGKQAEFTFSEPGCSVTGIGFVTETSAGTVTGKVEILKDLPETVLERPKGEVYQHMNIVIGSQIFGESGTFESAMVNFKVPRSWVEENNIDQASLVLNRYHDNSWVRLSTEKTGEDDEFLYFRAETPGFSYYSITGEKKDALTITPAATGSETDAQKTGDKVPDTNSEETKKSPGFEPLYGALGIISISYLLKRR